MTSFKNILTLLSTPHTMLKQSLQYYLSLIKLDSLENAQNKVDVIHKNNILLNFKNRIQTKDGVLCTFYSIIMNTQKLCAWTKLY